MADSEVTTQITRFEVIDDSGRVLTRYPARIELSYQDGGRTLKVFLSGEHPTAYDEHRIHLRDVIAGMIK